jgi:transcriptional regulator with XRE-family HTH domain
MSLSYKFYFIFLLSVKVQEKPRGCHLDIIKRIDYLNKKHGWSQYRLAKEANLPPTTIANIFYRQTLPSIPTLQAICNAYPITLSEFFLEEEDSQVLAASEQHRLLAYYEALTPAQQQAVLELLKSMSPQEKDS